MENNSALPNDTNIVSTSHDGSQLYIQNGTLGVRNAEGSTQWTLDQELANLHLTISDLQAQVTKLTKELEEKGEDK